MNSVMVIIISISVSVHFNSKRQTKSVTYIPMETYDLCLKNALRLSEKLPDLGTGTEIKCLNTRVK